MNKENLHAKFYTKGRVELVLDQKADAFSGKYGHSCLPLINKWFPDVAHMEIWYNSLCLLTINLVDIVYIEDNKKVTSDHIVIPRRVSKRQAEVLKEKLAEIKQLKINNQAADVSLKAQRDMIEEQRKEILKLQGYVC